MHEMLERMPARELTAWAAYEQVAGPLGQPRDDILVGILAERITSMLQSGKKRRRWRVDDFVPKWGRRKRTAQTPQEQRNLLLELTRRFGGTIRKR
ncbi:tail protein [Thermobifida phage P1312]|nr:tail protein [Thermobifida phage P1312]